MLNSLNTMGFPSSVSKFQSLRSAGFSVNEPCSFKLFFSIEKLDFSIMSSFDSALLYCRVTNMLGYVLNDFDSIYFLQKRGTVTSLIS